MGAAKWADGIVTWLENDTFCISVVFTWLLQRAKRLAETYRRKHPDARVIAGGPAVYLLGAPWADEIGHSTKHDVLSMHNPDATFTTRGCIRRCKFCAVPKIEGALRELKTWKVAPLVCDNNLLASSEEHFAKVMRSLRGVANVDFNQGLDARVFTPWHAEQIASIGRPVITRFALDHSRSIDAVGKAIDVARGAGLKEIRVYVLIGFHDTPEDAIKRLEFLFSIKVKAFPMRYQPLDAIVKNGYLSSSWTHDDMSSVVQYYYQGIRHGDSVQALRTRRSISRLRRGDTDTKRMFRRLARRKRLR